MPAVFTIKRSPFYHFWSGRDPLSGHRRKINTKCKDKDGALTFMVDWIKTQEKVRVGLLPPESVIKNAVKTLAQHLDDWKADQLAGCAGKKDSARTTVKMNTERVRLVMVDKLKYKHVRDIKEEEVRATIISFTEKPPKTRNRYRRLKPLNLTTCNHYLSKCRSFTIWLVDHDRLEKDPLRKLKRWNAKNDARHPRRPLSPDELRKLLVVTRTQPQYRDVTGEDRVFLYWCACVSGLRKSELSSIIPESFDLERREVTVLSAHTKNSETAVQPLPADLVEALKPWLASKPAGQPVWPGTWAERAVVMLRADLRTAGIPYCTPAGYADFHSFRHTFITWLGAAGTPVKVVQELARHSDAQMTLNVYSHVRLFDVSGAVEGLPKLSGSLGVTPDVTSPDGKATRRLG